MRPNRSRKPKLRDSRVKSDTKQRKQGALCFVADIVVFFYPLTNANKKQATNFVVSNKT
jgi:hypothetical protein